MQGNSRVEQSIKFNNRAGHRAYRWARRQALALAAVLTLSQGAVAAIELLDRVVAVVDQDVIMQSELDSRLVEIADRARQANMRLPDEEVLKKQVLDQLVMEKLQLSMARRFQVTIPDQEVLDATQRIMQSQNINQYQLEQALLAEGKTLNEFREKLRRELTMRTVSEGVVRQRIKISEQEINNFLKSADAQFWISPDYHLGHILIALPQSPTTKTIAEAEKKAQSLYQQLQKGANFAELAIAHSRGPAALKGGDLGWRKSSQLPTLFAEIAPTLEKGQVAKPARSQAGFHILKLHDKRGDTKQIVRQTKASHILLKTSEILDDEAAKQKLIGLRKQIEEGADFAKLAKEHSEDIASKLSGGDLGWSQPGMFVPEFTQAMNETPKGGVSEPFQTQFGWHIVQVVDRRDEDVTKDALRNKARLVLTNRRFEDEVQVWLQEMKDDAFIEIKI